MPNHVVALELESTNEIGDMFSIYRYFSEEVINVYKTAYFENLLPFAFWSIWTDLVSRFAISFVFKFDEY